MLAIEVRDLVKRYRGATGNAVDGISFDVPDGQLFCLRAGTRCPVVKLGALSPLECRQVRRIAGLTCWAGGHVAGKTQSLDLICQYSLTLAATDIKLWGVAMDEAATDETLRALAEPRRRAILRLVACDELAAGEIAKAFEVSRTAVSQHLTVLRNAGLLSERKAGTRRYYRARPEGLAGLREFLEDMWASSLDAARRLTETDAGATDDALAAAGGQLARWRP